MSALDGWIDVCRAGTWRDMAGRDVAIDEARLDRIVDAHAVADPAPVVVGHPETNAPAFAWIDGLRRVGDRLQAKLRDIAPAFREAVEAGRYAGRSIALKGDTLRHVGFLGGRAPAVSGLVPTRFASAPETVVAFADDAGAGSPEDSPSDHPDSLRALGPGGDEDGDSLVPLSALQGRGEAGEDDGVPEAIDEVGGKEGRPAGAARSERPATDGHERTRSLAYGAGGGAAGAGGSGCGRRPPAGCGRSDCAPCRSGSRPARRSGRR